MSLVDNLIEYINVNKIEGYKPLSKSGLSYEKIKTVYKSNPVVNKIVTKRVGSINQNLWNIHVEVSNVQRKNEILESKIYTLLKNEYKINTIITQLATVASIYGCAYLEFDEDKQFIVHEPQFWKPYFDYRKRKITKLYNSIDKKFYEYGKDIIRFDDCLQQSSDLPISFIDVAYDAILLNHHAIRANDNLISQGGVGTLLALVEKEYEAQMNTPTDANDPENPEKRRGAVMLRKLKESLGLSKRSIVYKKDTPTHDLAMVIGIKEIVSLSKSNQDIMLPDLIKYCENKIYDAGAVTNSDSDSTYNNSSNFNYQLYDDVGRKYEQALEDLINNFILTKLQVPVSENLYFEFNKPNDPDEIAKSRLLLDISTKTLEQSNNPKLKATVINELRDRLNLSLLEDSLFINEVEQVQPTLPSKKEDFSFSNVLDVEYFEKKKTPIEKALASDDFEGWTADIADTSKKVKKGLKPNFERALFKQIGEYISTTDEYSELEQYISNIDKDLNKLESYYSFNTLVKNLLKFVDVGLRELKIEDEQYPQYLTDYITDRAKGLLKGKSTKNPDQKSTDEALKSEIKTLLENTTIEDVKDDLKKFQKEYSKRKADLIARTEVANITEESRFLVFKEEGYKRKKWLTVNDSKVTPDHRQNEREGEIDIDDDFSNGEKRAGTRPNCRCTVEYIK